MDIEPQTILHIEKNTPRARVYGKRLFDIIGAAVILFITSPVLCLCAVAIKIDSRGPVLFSQRRRGLMASPFWLYKFRTMFLEDEDKLGIVQSRRHDARVTRVGSFLRRFSLDELTQLYNVLRGDMSLIGPRPHALGTNIKRIPSPAICDRYFTRYYVKPGITGWAQINGHRGILKEPADLIARLQDDLYYVGNMSLHLDVRILVRTAAIIFRDRNAF